MSVLALQSGETGCLLLLSGKPGAGKSTFCHETAVRNLVVGRPVLFVTTGQNTVDLLLHLREQGLGAEIPNHLAFVDAFSKTVGVAAEKRKDTAFANAHDFNSLSIAITKQQQRLGKGNTLLVLDALTDPYLFGGAGVLQFMRLFLSKFASEGNGVMATIDEGCGPQADLGAMQSISDGLVRLVTQSGVQEIAIVKHPILSPATIRRTIEERPWMEPATERITPETAEKIKRSFFGDGFGVRPTLGDFIHPFWPNMAYWSGMLWDPQRFPKVIYQHNREDQEMAGSDEHLQVLPQKYRFFFKLISVARSMGIFPKNFSSVADMRKVWRFRMPYHTGALLEKCAIISYLPEKSSHNEHHYRIEEQATCFGFKDVGACMGWYMPSMMAGQLIALESEDRPWTAVETRCIGLGDPHCEVKIVPGESDDLLPSLVKDATTLACIHARLADQSADFLLKKVPLPTRPTMGPVVHLQTAFHAFGFPHIAGQRSQMAMRLGGAKLGAQVGERLATAVSDSDEAVQHLVRFLNDVKVGIVDFDPATGELRIRENVEPQRTVLMTDIREPSCYFTTGFLSGLVTALDGRQVREKRCIAAGDPYCAWIIN